MGMTLLLLKITENNRSLPSFRLPRAKLFISNWVDFDFRDLNAQVKHIFMWMLSHEDHQFILTRREIACYSRNLPSSRWETACISHCGYYDERPIEPLRRGLRVGYSEKWLVFFFQRLKEYTHYTDTRQSLHQQHKPSSIVSSQLF